MSKIERSYLCVHGHFNQPPRGNPLTGEIGVEPEAAPYQDLNELVTNTSYTPNAEAGNFANISFSFGEPLLQWIEKYTPETFNTIVGSDKKTGEVRREAGNALATAYYYPILPLARKRDKRTQIAWGIAAFEHHFGRRPLGFWLPEMAVDTETLLLLAEAGIRYTVLSRKQIHDFPLEGGAGPYCVELPGGKNIAVFVRSDELSSELSFNIHNLGGAGHWAHHVLAPARRSAGTLLLLAIEGETFGHHHAGEEQFLYWLMHREALDVGYQATTLDAYFLENPPTHTVRVEPRSSWGIHPGLTRWTTGLIEHHMDTTWRGALRRALDNVASELDRAYEEALRPHDINPWELRDRYVAVLTGQLAPTAFLARHAPMLKDGQIEQVQGLLVAQDLAQRMYNSYSFNELQLEGRLVRFAIACAAAALVTAQQATGRDLSERVVSDLAVVTCPGCAINGAYILESVMAELDVQLPVTVR